MSGCGGWRGWARGTRSSGTRWGHSCVVTPVISSSVQEELGVREEVVAVQGQHWGLGVDSVLAGHEGWVSNGHWEY